MALDIQTKVTENGIGRALPSGYTAPTVDHAFTDASVKINRRNFTMTAASVTNATPSTFLSAVVTAVEGQVTTLFGDGAGNLGIDEGTNSVDVLVTIVKVVKRAFDPANAEGWLENGEANIIVTCDIEYEVTA